ncbi:MAG TPA: anaerobic ribonucleoside-triphosphate reductase activating protein [Syntrophales bacterium]|nr:anaerobic ribonucleoside-triphosphate reductase activating protein [Syntrophales bacterium]
MLIGGLQKVSLIEYPGRISAIAFTQGCNFRCPYCYNPELVDPGMYEECIPEESVLAFLEKRKGKLEALTVTGGEPTMQGDLAEFVGAVKDKGYLVKLDTNGSSPDVLEKLLSKRLVDYIAMDIKAPLTKYRALTKSKIDENMIRRSIDFIMTSGLPYEFRTTVPKKLLHEDDLIVIGDMLKGARCYILQRFIPTKTLDKQFLKYEPYSDNEMEAFRGRLARDMSGVYWR